MIIRRYKRTAEVWSYDTVEGAKPLQTYHEAGAKSELDDIKEAEGLGGTETGEDERGVRLGYIHYNTVFLFSAHVTSSNPFCMAWPSP